MESQSVVGRYLAAVVKEKTKGPRGRPPARPFLTISREAGAGARAVGQKIVDVLNQQQQDVPWTLFDKNLVDVVLEDHNLPKEVSKYMAEDAVSTLQKFVDDLFGQPPSHSLVRKTNETIVTLAKMGNAVLVGRGGNFLTRGLEGGFHVRLVASPDKRIKRLQEYYGLSDKQAADRLKTTDEDRRKYVHDVFGKDVRDIASYDCVINTTWLSDEAAANLIANHLRG